LLGIDLYFSLQPGGAVTAISFDIYTGFDAPGSYNNMLLWSNLLPNYFRGQLTRWLVDSENWQMHRDMAVRLTGQGRRFGWAAIGSNTNPGYLSASFQISEG